MSLLTGGNHMYVKEVVARGRKMEWISFDERSPEKTGLYLVSGKWKDKPPKVWIARFVEIFDGLRGWENDTKNPVVDFWMPLPKSPYEE